LLGIESVVARAGGLDQEHDWDSLLSLHEQRFVSFARILLASPRFAVLYNPFKDLDPGTAGRLLKILSDYGITYLTMGHEGPGEGEDRNKSYDGVLELAPGGGWTWREVRKN
jgi:putative ATP-binding cassette transporter